MKPFTLFVVLLFVMAGTALFHGPSLPTVEAGSTSTSLSTMQVTLGSGTTQMQTASLGVYQIILQNNATHSMRCGDSNTSSSRGALLASGGGSMNFGPMSFQGLDLSQFYCAGTSGDVVDVLYLH
jgi:hypothetical protein